jgi:ketosteroid isomerase-like protein
MRGKTKGGTEITMPAAIRFVVANNRITRIEEYLDPAPLMRALKAEG